MEGRLATGDVRVCRYCKRTFRAVVTASSWAKDPDDVKKMPVDPEPSPEHGTITLDARRHAVLWPKAALIVLRRSENPPLIYTTHFATCPSWPGRKTAGKGRERPGAPSSGPETPAQDPQATLFDG